MRRPVRKSNTEEITETEVSALMMSDLIEARVWRVSETESLASSIDEDDGDEILNLDGDFIFK